MTRSHQGFSLVELMIAVVLGLILMTGVIQMFLGSRAAFSSQQAISRVQETGRLSVEFLARDIRMAGFLGCPSRRANSLIHLNNPTDFANDWLNSIQGYHINNTGAGAPAGANLVPTPLNDTDLFVIRRAQGNGVITRADNTDTTLFTNLVTSELGGCGATARVNGFCPGDVVVESDCISATVFQISGINVVGSNADITHTAVTPIAPGNAVPTWGGPTAAPPDHPYLMGSEIYRLSRTIYFIAVGPSGRPSLYQNLDGVNTELLEGVEDMSITYGVATGTDPDAPPDQYLAAASVTNWRNVLSLRIQLLIQSAEDNVMPENQTYSFDTDINKKATDKRLRQVFVSTVGIRSRLDSL